MGNNFCCHCGNPLLGSEKFCTSCGSQLSLRYPQNGLGDFNYNTKTKIMENKKWMPIASMILAILSVFVDFLPNYLPINIFFSLLSFPLSIAGLVFGIICIKKNYGIKGLAIAGLVISSIILCIDVFSFMGGFISGFIKSFTAATHR